MTSQTHYTRQTHQGNQTHQGDNTHLTSDAVLRSAIRYSRPGGMREAVK